MVGFSIVNPNWFNTTAGTTLLFFLPITQGLSGDPVMISCLECSSVYWYILPQLSIWKQWLQKLITRGQYILAYSTVWPKWLSSAWILLGSLTILKHSSFLTLWFFISVSLFLWLSLSLSCLLVSLFSLPSFFISSFHSVQSFFSCFLQAPSIFLNWSWHWMEGYI